jgi:hypothetical protein
MDGGRWIETEFGPVWKAEKPKRTQTPHAKAKAELRDTLTEWKKRTGVSAYYIPYFVGKVWMGEGRQKRKAHIGRPGVSDVFIATMGCVLACEVKAGRDTPSALQVSFKERWEKTGNPHIVYRKPSDLTDVLDQMAAQRGFIF